MIPLPTQITTLYLILSVTVALFSVILAILVGKSKKLDRLQSDFSEKELNLNQKLYETSVIKNKLEAMVQQMTEGVFMVDKDFKLLVVNSACKRLLDLKKSTASLTIFDLVRAFNDYYPIEEAISKVFEDGELKKVSEVKVDDMFIQITLIPVEVAEGVPGVGVLLHDQTEEQTLRHKHEEFMAMVVHELRAPLTVIKGMADLLITNKERLKEGQKDDLLAQIRTSSVEVLTIVNDLLDETKMDLAKFKIDKREGNLSKVLKAEASKYSKLAEEKGLKFTSSVDKTLPKFNFDSVKVTQVMNNLISNSLKFTKEGSINVKAELVEDTVQVSVEDTGKGVPDEKKSKLFQKFVQLESSEPTAGPGTGLGLVISKAIVEAHGGKIWIEDNKPQGARFVFTLPVD